MKVLNNGATKLQQDKAALKTAVSTNQITVLKVKEELVTNAAKVVLKFKDKEYISGKVS